MTLFEDFQEEVNRVDWERIMRHGNEKTKFETGAHRDTDEGKGKPSLISPVLIHRLGVLLAKGAEHYGADNWVKGMPYRRTADSMIRHIYQWLAGDEEEDHLAAVCFGAMCLMHYEDDYSPGPELDDRNEGLKKILPSILTSPASEPTIKQSNDRGTQISLNPCKGSCGGDTAFVDQYCHGCTMKGKNPGMKTC